MSTANAYLQADMVGVSSDVSGIVAEVTVHSNRKVAKRRAVQSLRTAVQPMDRAGR
jgi:membrane fusion protein, multidrug efflux system